MDPALQELILHGQQEEEVEAIIRLNDATHIPAGVQVVSRFGDIITCRLRHGDITDVYADESVVSMKAARYVGVEPSPEEFKATALNSGKEITERYSSSFDKKGKGVVIGVIDWGFDFTHPNFRDEAGQTRLLTLWDQTSANDVNQPRFGYGQVHSKSRINAALNSPFPFEVLDYHPAKGDPNGDGAHGTHVLDLAAGNGTTGVASMAGNAEIVAVHLSAGKMGALSSLGDSVRILEAINFISEVAANRPLVINLSVGKHGGPHNGKTLVEQGMDNFLQARSGRSIVQSTGNYYAARTHASGNLQPGGQRNLGWHVYRADKTYNELEIYLPGDALFEVTLTGPNNSLSLKVELGEKEDIILNNEVVGRFYHRKNEPNSGYNHVDIFLYKHAPPGDWSVTLELITAAETPAWFHAWIERDGSCLGCQSRFELADADPLYTTGSICNGKYTIAVGAYNAYSGKIASFSSSGPTIDGRNKPMLVASGIRVRAAKSSPGGSAFSKAELIQKSGTSMAAPQITSAVAALFGEVGRLLPIEETLQIIKASLVPFEGASSTDAKRKGLGKLSVTRLFKLSKINTAQRTVNPIKTSAFDQLVKIETPKTLHECSCKNSQDGVDKAKRKTSISKRVNKSSAGTTISSQKEERNRQSIKRKKFSAIARGGEMTTSLIQAGDLILTKALGEGISFKSIIKESVKEGLKSVALQAKSLDVAGGPEHKIELTDSEGYLLPQHTVFRSQKAAEQSPINFSIIAARLAIREETLWGNNRDERIKEHEPDIRPRLQAYWGSVTNSDGARQVRSMISWRRNKIQKEISALELKLRNGNLDNINRQILTEKLSSLNQQLSTKPQQWYSNYPWSAVFISWLMRKAGAKSNFYYSASHIKYIYDAFLNKQKNRSNRYWFFSLTDGNWNQPHKFLVGDLICMNRKPSNFNQDKLNTSYQRGLTPAEVQGNSHCDIITRIIRTNPKGQGNQVYLETIGGNVSNTVRKTFYRLDSSGNIVEGFRGNIDNNKVQILNRFRIGKIFGVLKYIENGQNSKPNQTNNNNNKSIIQNTVNLRGSVGLGGRNIQGDVLNVQSRLINLGYQWALTDSNGRPKKSMLNAIKLFQGIINGVENWETTTRRSVDGLIQPDLKTFRWLFAANAPKWGAIPNEGKGWKYQIAKPSWGDDRYGTDWLHSFIYSIGLAYFNRMEEDMVSRPPITIHELSAAQGEPSGHKGHRTGLMLDIRLPRTDGGVGKTTTSSFNYDRYTTRIILEIINQHPLFSVAYLNDKILRNEGLCRFAKGHGNHIHVKIKPPKFGDTRYSL